MEDAGLRLHRPLCLTPPDPHVSCPSRSPFTFFVLRRGDKGSGLRHKDT